MLAGFIDTAIPRLRVQRTTIIVNPFAARAEREGPGDLYELNLLSTIVRGSDRLFAEWPISGPFQVGGVFDVHPPTHADGLPIGRGHRRQAPAAALWEETSTWCPTGRPVPPRFGHPSPGASPGEGAYRGRQCRFHHAGSELGFLEAALCGAVQLV